MDLHRAFIRKSPFINHVLYSRHALATLARKKKKKNVRTKEPKRKKRSRAAQTYMVNPLFYFAQYTHRDGGAPIGHHLRRQEIPLSQKDIPQGMQIPEAFSSELCCSPSSA
jgi:hypothetical protein